MKQNFYWILVVGVLAIILAGCKNKISQENVFKGEWDYTEPDTVPNPPNDPYGADMTTNYFVKCNLYEKFDLGEGYPKCYGIYQITDEVNQAELALDSILYLSVDSAEVLCSNIDYPEEDRITLSFKYNEKDSTLTISRIFQYSDDSGSIIERVSLPRYNGKENSLN